MRWADLDVLGHVNNVVYADYLQEARVDMLRVHARSPRTDGLAEGVLVASHQVSYLEPLHFDHDPVYVDLWVTEIRAAAFTLAYEVYREHADGERSVYLRASTLLVPLLGVLIEMLVAKGVVSTLGHYGYIELSSFAVNIVIALTLGAGTDYGIFLMGRYHEARQAGESREDSFYIAYKGVAPIIIGSGLTIAGACYCLTFARLNYFHTMGPAVAITMLFTIAAAMTLGPAVLTVGSPASSETWASFVANGESTERCACTTSYRSARRVSRARRPATGRPIAHGVRSTRTGPASSTSTAAPFSPAGAAVRTDTSWPAAAWRRARSSTKTSMPPSCGR